VAAGHEVQVLSRRTRAGEPGVRFVTGDLVTGAGVDAAVEGVATTMHCASDRKGDAEATATLVRAASRASVSHLIFISIVGLEQIPFGYTRTKLNCERIVVESRIPWTIPRATQSYTMILDGVRRLARLPVVPVPAGFILQPVDPDDVAARLVELAWAEPAGRVPDLAGPQVLSFAVLVRGYLAAIGRRCPVVSVWLPGTGKIRAGALLPATTDTGGRTWEDFLSRNPSHPSPPSTSGAAFRAASDLRHSAA
jgi:uncharacterized protein YbjT (DUF2867 family)